MVHDTFDHTSQLRLIETLFKVLAFVEIPLTSQLAAPAKTGEITSQVPCCGSS
jgi:hypothetical protein